MANRYCISVVIPSYNRKVDLLQTLGSVLRQNRGDCQIIVIDDNSRDDSVLRVREAFPRVDLHTLGENQGPAIARNEGIKRASGDIIVGLDSDVVLPHKNLLARIAQRFSTSREVNCLAFRVLNYFTGKDDTKTWWHPFSIEGYAHKEFYTDYFSGTGYAFRREVFEKAGYFPEDLFMHGEEVDLALRILDAGFDILYDPSIVVLHKVSPQARNRRIQFYFKRRNQMWIVAKYYPILKGLGFIIPRLAKTFVQAASHGELATYCKAIWDGLTGLPAALENRKPLKRQTWRKIKQIRKGIYRPDSVRPVEAV